VIQAHRSGWAGSPWPGRRLLLTAVIRRPRRPAGRGWCANSPRADPPRDPVWTAAIGSATPDEAYAVAVEAYAHSRLGDAAAAFGRARDSSSTNLAASAGYNLGVTLGQLDRPHGGSGGPASWDYIVIANPVLFPGK